MSAAARPLLVLALLAGACSRAPEPQAANNDATITDIDTLPPDESVATPAEELDNGVAEPAGANAASDNAH